MRLSPIEIAWASVALSTSLLLACTSDPVEGTSGDADASGSGASPGDSNTGGVADGTSSNGSESAADTSNEEGVGDESSGSTGEPGEDPGLGEPGPDLRQRGPFEFEVTSGTESVGSGCNMAYDRFEPIGGDSDIVVFLAHGMQGNMGSMVGWAEHWASWGLPVITPNLCHATIADADHQANGEELRLLAANLGLDRVIYAGHSAGGLASFVAGSGESTAVAVFGLDMVDTGGVGGMAVSSMSVPAFNLMSEPATCNVSGNAAPLYRATGGRVIKLVDSDHCDFQNPSDAFCGLCMAQGMQFDPVEIQTAVRGMSTGFLLWQSGLDATGKQWWTPGAGYYEELLASGLISEA